MAGGRFQHDPGSTGTPYPSRLALDSIAFLPAIGDKAWYLDPASPIGRYEAMWKGAAWSDGYLPSSIAIPGSPSAPFADSTERDAYFTANPPTVLGQYIFQADGSNPPKPYRWHGGAPTNWQEEAGVGAAAIAWGDLT